MPTRDWEQEIQNEVAERQAITKSNYSLLVCPRSYGERCKLCELIGIKFSEFYAGNIAKDFPNYSRDLTGVLWTKKPGSKIKGDWVYPENTRTFARSIRANKYYYANIVFPFSADPAKVFIFEFTNSIFEFLLKHTSNPNSEYYGFWDIENGTNITITKSLNLEKGMNEYKSEFKRNTTPIPSISSMNQVCQLEPEFIIKVKKEGIVPFIKQSEFEMEDTVIRILPFDQKDPYHWFTKMYYHFGLFENDYDRTLTGEFNPFSDIKQMSEEPISNTSGSARTSIPPARSFQPVQCFGDVSLYSINDPDCTTSCAHFIECGHEVQRKSASKGMVRGGWKEKEDDIPF